MVTPSRLFILAMLTTLVVNCPAVAAAEPDAASPEFFETKVRPVLAQRCYECHSGTSKKVKGGLRVDSREAMLAGGDGGPALVPGDPAKSRLVVGVTYADPDLQMPPKSKLPAAEIAALSAWVKAGAPWPDGPAGPAAAVAKAEFDVARRKAAHWAWQPVRPHDPPAVKDAAWARTPIDRFVLAKLEEKNLRPASPADRRALIRRLSFDLTGLPPTPAEVEAFVNDPSPDATAKVVDRLLASPHFGERWGRHWLDLVRYAETRGHEFDYLMPDAWRYRDYVIRALNADVPYNQFVTEHVAGDLLPEPRKDPTGAVNESVIGTGFWFLNEWVHSPVDIRDDECVRVDNQIDVFGKAFLGLTIGCARCHDHKFDAIGAKDYYALAGFLNSSSYREVRFEHQDHNRDVLRRVSELDATIRRRVLADLAEAKTPTVRRIEGYLLGVRDAAKPGATVAQVAADRGLAPDLLAKWVEEVSRAAGDPSHPFAEWADVVRGRRHDEGKPPAEQTDEAREAARKRGEAARGTEGSVVVDYERPGSGRWIADGLAFGDGPQPVGSVTLGTDERGLPALSVREVAAADSAAISGRLPGMLRTPEFVITAPKLWYRVSGAGEAFVVVDSHRMIQGPLHGSTRMRLNVKRSGKSGDGSWEWVAHDVKGYLGQRAHVEFTPAGEPRRLEVACVVQSEARPPAPDGATRDAGRAMRPFLVPGQPPDDIAGEYQRILERTLSFIAADQLTVATEDHGVARWADWMLRRPDLFGCDATQLRSIGKTIQDYQSERIALLSQIKDSATAMAMLDGNGVDERVLLRGSHKTPGDVVPRRFLEAIGGPDQTPMPAHTSGRLELARRMTDPSNPLPARVMVNRVWHHLFGRGIVASVDDFGVMGQPPTHPELLDHLADRFVKEEWSIKRLIREVALSNAYQMSTGGDPSAAQVDPQNLLLHRANVRRLEGEAIRDAILAVSGRLDAKPYGPSVEAHLTPFMDGRGRPNSGPLDGDGRRSVYTRVRRNFLPPMMLAFDMPAPFNCMGRRTVSNVPAQALTLLNDPFVVQQAESWAKRVLAEKGLTSPRQRIERMYVQAYARPPTDAEAAAAESFIHQQGQALGLSEQGALTDARVWADFAHVLINVKEFIFLP